MFVIVAIIEFNTGQQVRMWFRLIGINRGSLVLGAASGTTIAGQTGIAGAFADQFSSPTSLTFDQFGNLYVVDSGNNRVQKWSPGATFGITVVAASSLSNPRGIAFDPSGNMVVADYSNHRIIRFAVTCREYWSGG